MSKQGRTAKNVSLTLLENSDSFTEEAIRNAIQAESDPHRWKFAILHIVQAIELCLKGILENAHPALIYDDVDKPKHTVGVEKAIGRIQRYLKQPLSKEDIQTLMDSARVRNAIVHSSCEFDPVQAKANFARHCGFLRDLFRKFFDGEHLADYMDKKLWKQFLKIEANLQEMRGRAMVDIENDPNVTMPERAECPICGAPALVFPDPKLADVKCLCCGFSDQLWQCDGCHRDFFEGLEPPEEGSRVRSYCQSCRLESMEYDEYLYQLGREG